MNEHLLHVAIGEVRIRAEDQRGHPGNLRCGERVAAASDGVVAANLRVGGAELAIPPTPAQAVGGINRVLARRSAYRARAKHASHPGS